MSRCSVILHGGDSADSIEAVLDQVLARRGEDYADEVVVVGEAFTDLAAGTEARVRVLAAPESGGVAAARNAGAAAATEEFLVFLDRSAVPQAGWLAALKRVAADHPAPAVVGATLLAPNDTVRHAGIAIGLDRYPHFLYAGFPSDDPAVARSRRVQAVGAACILVQRQTFADAGGFDPSFDDGWEAIDLCLRLQAGGQTIQSCHDSVVYLPTTDQGWWTPDQLRNRERYAARWLEQVEPDDLKHYAADRLLRVAYPPTYPLRLAISPRLARVEIEHPPSSKPAAIPIVASPTRETPVAAIMVEPTGPSPSPPVWPPLPVPIDQGDIESVAPAAASGWPVRLRRSLAPVGSAAARPTRLGQVTGSILAACDLPTADGQTVVAEHLPVAGWALSTTGVRAIDVFVDGRPRGVVVNGQARPDVAELHPEMADALHGGFTGTIPVGDLASGEHRLVLRVISGAGDRIDLRTRFRVDTAVRTRRPLLAACDRPNPNRRTVVIGRLEVAGWALAASGVVGIEALVAGEARGVISYGRLRPDVAVVRPDYPDGAHCGFGGMIPVADLPPGDHQLLLRVLATDGSALELAVPFEVPTSQVAMGEVPLINARYQEWLREHLPTEVEIAAARAEVAALEDRPTIALIVPIGDADPSAVAAVVDAVRAQTYEDWELWLTGVTSPEHEAAVGQLAAADPRITVVTAESPADGPRTALAQSDGRFVGLLDPTVVLSPLALGEAARLLVDAPETDVLYADEDKVEADGALRWDPFFKPDWSPDLLLSTNYFGAFTLYRRSLVDEVGGIRPEFGGGEAYDLALRVTERTSGIRHLPLVLASRRSVLTPLPDETVPDPAADRSRAGEGNRQALSDAIARRGIDGRVEAGTAPDRWRVRYRVDDSAGVTIVLPTGGKLQFLRPCLDDLLAKTSYPNLHVLVVDNSEDTAVAELCDDLARQHPHLRRQEFRQKPFNFSAICNQGMTLVDTPYVVLLNDDITVITPDWVQAMLEHAQRPEVGVVGAKLLFPDDTIQHAGVLLGLFGLCGNAFRLIPDGHSGYFGLPQVVRNYSAVTFACAMMRREVYDEVGGLDAANLPVAFNDVDLCLRVGALGYRIVYTPHAVLFHHESVTKQVIVAPGEIDHMLGRYADVIRDDPFYNPNLTRRNEDWALDID